MYNYSKNSVSINEETMTTINRFNEMARAYAMESIEHNTQKHNLEDAIESLVREEKSAVEEQKALDTLEDEWKKRTKYYNLMLYGGKDGNGEKVVGVCDIVTNDLYKAYVDNVTNGTTKKYREELKNFVLNIINGDNIKEGAFNHLYNDILATMSSVRYNSNSQIAQGSAFITTINKRTYKKMLLGAIVDIVSNNKTLKVKKVKADK